MANFPMKSCFRMVGNDATFYRLSTADELRRYLNSIPEDFEMWFKVWEELTVPGDPQLARTCQMARPADECTWIG